MSPREIRHAKNQALFRSVNDRIVALAAQLSGEDFQIICECANTGCIERLDVPLGEYARVRESPDWFLITPGHIFADDEQLIEHCDGYDIVKA